MKNNIENYYELAAMRLKEIRESIGLNQKDFAEMFGVNHTTYCRYESGDIKNMPNDFIQNVSGKFDINPAWIMGFPKEEKYRIPLDTPKKPKRVPLIGTIAAGIPILAQQNIEDYEFVPEDLRVDFCLRVKGDSMINARILDGDIVFIRKQPEVESGEIAVVMIDDEEATLKRVYKSDGTVILRAENPNYPDRVFNKKDRRKITILGKAIKFTSEVR